MSEKSATLDQKLFVIGFWKEHLLKKTRETSTSLR